VVESNELRRAEQSLSAAYELARGTGYRSGSREMHALHLSEQAHQDARGRRQQEAVDHLDPPEGRPHVGTGDGE